MKLTDLGEKEIIRRMSSFLDIGDDAAYIRHGDGFLILTTDMIYEDTHRLPGMTYEQIGRFIVSINASDIAAMGAKPLAFLLAYGGPDIEVSEFEAIIHAVDAQCKRYGMQYAGGDTKQAGKLTLSGFCIGTAKAPVLRSTARPGDVIAVTGTLGDASLGTKMLLENRKEYRRSHVVQKALEPQARIKEGMMLNGHASAMMDISDSLAFSLHDIANMSRVGVRLYADDIPLSDDARMIAKDLGLDVMDYALYGGGDYELLYTAGGPESKKIAGKVNATIIGEVTKEGVYALRGGEEFTIEKRGYEHFRKRR